MDAAIPKGETKIDFIRFTISTYFLYRIDFS